MAEPDEKWDFSPVTDTAIDVDLIRGTYHSTSRNDQLYIWVRKSDESSLKKRMKQWLTIADSVGSGYRKISVHIVATKNYPMSVIYKCGTETISEITIKELGNFPDVERAKLIKLNESLAPDQRYIINMGNQSVKGLNNAMKLGMQFQRHLFDMEDLEYVLISTKESGLITDDSILTV